MKRLAPKKVREEEITTRIHDAGLAVLTAISTVNWMGLPGTQRREGLQEKLRGKQGESEGDPATRCKRGQSN